MAGVRVVGGVMPAGTWDVFCHVVDNHGDLGICWRLARQLAARGRQVRLYVDRAEALAWMAPTGCAGVEVFQGLEPPAPYTPGDVVVTTLDSRPGPAALAALAQAGTQRRMPWIHLEYLSAEAYAGQSHALASPVAGAPAGLQRWFYFPGFTQATGGLLREDDLLERRRRFDAAAWRAARGHGRSGGPLASLFCYEPTMLADLLLGLDRHPMELLVTHGRAAGEVQRLLPELPARWRERHGPAIRMLPPLSQDEYDELLWACDLNFVRGEDSLVRALWADRPFVWQAYPQDGGAQAAKLEAFLDWLAAPADLARFHRLWNGVDRGGALPAIDLPGWQAVVSRARTEVSGQESLVDRLLRFAAEKS